MSVTRRHHYVWRYYLSAWENDGTIAVSRLADGTFKTDPINVAVQKDFYKIPKISEADVLYLARFITTMMPNAALRDLAFGWVKMYAAPSELRRFVASHGLQDDATKVLAEITKMEIQLEESIHSSLEGDAKPFLDNIRTGAKNPLEDDADALPFCIYLSFQHMRTKKMRDNMLDRSPTEEMRELMSRTYPVLRAIFATNLGWSIFSDRKNWRIRRLTAGYDLEFITSDQPSWNMLDAKGDNDLAIYYPVSPRVAILLEHVGNRSVVGYGDSLPDTEIERLNNLVVERSHEQIFGTNIDYLKELRALACYTDD